MKVNNEFLIQKNEEPFKSPFWDIVYRMVKERGYTIDYFGNHVGISPRVITVQHSIGNPPKLDSASRIAKFLGTSIDYLYTGIEENTLPEVREVKYNPDMKALVKYLMEYPDKMDAVLTMLNIGKKESSESATV